MASIIKTAASPTETFDFAKTFAEEAPKNAVLLLNGELGAGKTMFVKGLAAGLGIKNDITSPTFALVNEYAGLFHFDLYRLDSIDDLYAVGFYDYLERGGVIAAEWWKWDVGVFAGRAVYTVTLEKTGENEREITVTAV